MQDYSKNIQENNSKSKKKQKIEKQKKRQQGNDSQNQNSKNTKKKIVKTSNLVQEKLGTNILRKIQNKGGKRAKIQKKQNFRKKPK